MKRYILYLAYGSIDVVNECRYSLLKYLQVYNLTPPVDIGIVIYTDMPSWFDEFEYFFHSFEVKTITKEQIQSWRGEVDFMHRVKVEAIMDFFGDHDATMLYCDADTYLTSRIDDLFQDIENGSYYLHEYEGVIDKELNPSFHKWQRFLTTTPVHYNGKTIEYTKVVKMWNAGVIGMSSRDKGILEDVLSITDSIYSKFKKHIAEQFAFSYCFQRAGEVKSAAGRIGHYWNLKEFRRLLKVFFKKNGEESIPNLVKMVHKLDAMTIQSEKNVYEELPMLARISKTLSGKSWKINNYLKRI